VTRHLRISLVLLGILVLGTSNLSAVISTISGSHTTGSVKGSWRLLPPGAGSGSLNSVLCPDGTTACGYFTQQSASGYSFLNDPNAPSGKYWGWHGYDGTSNAATFMDSMVICQSGCNSAQHFTFGLTGGASLRLGNGTTQGLPWRNPTNDNGYFLSTPGPSGITIQFGYTGSNNNWNQLYVKSFDFYWGSADTWNSISLTDVLGHVTTFNGSDFCSNQNNSCFGFADPNHQSPPPNGPDITSALIDFSALADVNGNIYPWTSVTFSSTYPAFELDNLQFVLTTYPSAGDANPGSAATPTPEPSSLLLLGSGIAGISQLLRNKFRR